MMHNIIGELTECFEGTNLQSKDPQTTTTTTTTTTSTTTTNDNDEGWLISHIDTKLRNDEENMIP
jgi:hypothetical protein